MKRVRNYFILFSLLLLTCNLLGQPVNVCVSCPGGINIQPNETSIAINPLNTRQIMVGANNDNYYYSTDGGNTWTKGVIISSFGVWCDPVIISDTSGNFYHLNVSDTGLVGCQKYSSSLNSWNNGTTFGIPHDTLNPLNDKPWATVDTRNNNFYATWTLYYPWLYSLDSICQSNVYFSSSFDQGQTWSVPRKINKNSGDCHFKDVIDPKPCTGTNNEIYVTWDDSAGIQFNKSLDLGNTWLSNPILVSTIPGSTYFDIPCVQHGRNRPAPITLCDISNSQYRGTIYSLWSDARNGNSDIFIVKSADNGQNWSSPKRVNDDSTNTNQFMGTMAIDQTNGNLYALFYDRRNYFDCTTDVYMAVSKDGANTFTNYKVNEFTVTAVNDSMEFLGDYISIAAHNNVIRPTWTKMVQWSETSIWTALIGESYTGISGLENNLHEITIYPNPTTNTITLTGITQKTTLKLFDVVGKLVLEKEAEGNITLDISRFPEGIYTIITEDNKGKTFNKVIITK